ncbi:MAG: 3'-5' exonuclease [Patescibacteria group bacterium]
MKLSLPKTFVLFDLEYTAWEKSYERNWSGENEHREIIQIGAIRVSGQDLREETHLLDYVKPTRNPLLSDFITSLTNITQADIDTRGISFKETLIRLGDFVGDFPAYCWGRDIEVLEENCRLVGCAIPSFFSQMENLKPLLAPRLKSIGIDTKHYTSGTLISAFIGEQESRRAHDALNDMRNFRDALLELEHKLD